jgi:hypothetical protein
MVGFALSCYPVAIATAADACGRTQVPPAIKARLSRWLARLG